MKRSAVRIILPLLLVCWLINPATAQKSNEERNKEFRHRFSIAGNLGFQFGTVTGIFVSPEVKFRAVDQLYFGLGFNYQYLRWKDYYYDFSQAKYIDLTSNVFGGRIFSRYYLSSLLGNDILGNIFAHIEYEYLVYTIPYQPSGPPPDGYIMDYLGYWHKPGTETYEINSIFVGGGYKQPITNSMFLDLLILFNLNDTYNSPYTNPVVRIGFGATL